MIYFIGDPHLGHMNAIKFDNRPFKDMKTMINVFISNWNKRVQDNDTVYVLGDFFWDQKIAKEVLKQLKGKKILIRGNHDHKWLKGCTQYFEEICDYKRLVIDNRIVILFHYPIAVWDQKHRGAIHFYAHVHTNENDGVITHNILNHEEMKNAYNVGCMMPWMDYTPRTFSEIINYKNV